MKQPYFSFFHVIFALLLLSAVSGASSGASAQEAVSGIRVEGAQRVEQATIRSYLGLSEGDTLDRRKLNDALKKLYATELFSDVSVTEDAGVITVKVVENPLVNKVAFEGNKKFENDDLAKEIQLRSRAIYSRTRVQQDVERIINLYQRSGRFKANVVPKVIQQSQNRVDVVFEIDEGAITKIKDIFFVGNQIYSASQLRSVVRTEISRWYKFFSSDDTYDPDRLDYDKEMLRRYYAGQGYADFRVKSAVAELSPEGDGFYITFTVEEGERYDFGSIAYDVKLDDVKPEQLEALVKTKSGEVYNAIQVEDSVDAIVTNLGDLGYAFVDVDPKLDKNPATRKVNITYIANEAPRVYVERINITGNVRTLDEVIRREFRIAEGDPFSASKLKRSEQRIRNLGFFEKVNIATTPGTTQDRATINVELAEKSTGELSLGGGFSTVDGPLADVGLKESNLLGRGAELSTRMMIAQRRQEVQLSYTEPFFLNREISAGFDLFKTEQNLTQESSYDSASTGGALRMSYALSEHLTHGVSYTLREDSVMDVQPYASRYIREQIGDYITSSVGHVLTYDTRDNRFDPTEGFFIRFKQDLAGLGGDVSYLRNELKGGYYYSVIPQWVVSVSGAGGYLAGFDDPVRINDRFFIGSRQLRGFNNAGIGPRDFTTTDALGGNIYYTGSAELMFPLGLPADYNLRGAIFADVGSLWETDSKGWSVVDENVMRVTVGAGVAWGSPFGPIRLDFGQAIVKESYDETELIRFTFGTRF